MYPSAVPTPPPLQFWKLSVIASHFCFTIPRPGRPALALTPPVAFVLLELAPGPSLHRPHRTADELRRACGGAPAGAASPGSSAARLRVCSGSMSARPQVAATAAATRCGSSGWRCRPFVGRRTTCPGLVSGTTWWLSGVDKAASLLLRALPRSWARAVLLLRFGFVDLWAMLFLLRFMDLWVVSADKQIITLIRHSDQ